MLAHKARHQVIVRRQATIGVACHYLAVVSRLRGTRCSNNDAFKSRRCQLCAFSKELSTCLQHGW